jgi:hypothetical protein
MRLTMPAALLSALVAGALTHKHNRLGGLAVTLAGCLLPTGPPATLAVGNVIYPPIVSPGGLPIATILAVFKPWGLIRTSRVVTRAAR